MIGAASKEVEETDTMAGQKRSNSLRREFWAVALERLRADGVPMSANISPGNDNWLSAGSGIGGCPFQILFLRQGARVELSIGKPDAEQNKRIFDCLHKRKDQVEAEFGPLLEWLRIDDLKVSLILLQTGFDGLDRENWPAMVA